MVTIGHINAIHGLQNVPHSGEEDGPRGRMRDGRGIEEGREGVKGEREGRRGGKKEKEGGEGGREREGGGVGRKRGRSYITYIPTF